MQQNINLVLLGNRSSQNLFDVMATLKATRPNLRIIVIGSGMEDETLLKAIAFGAMGYVDLAASPADFVHAIRVVRLGSVWAPRRVLSVFIERVSQLPGRFFPAGRTAFTAREKEVLELLVGGRSNKEIGAALGIEERTVKARNRLLSPTNLTQAETFGGSSAQRSCGPTQEKRGNEARMLLRLRARGTGYASARRRYYLHHPLPPT